MSAERYPFITIDATLGEASLCPYLPITLHNSGRNVEASGLVDTGSSINVLPYEIGQRLGLDWDAQTTPLQLSGNLAGFEARVIFLQGSVGRFSPVRLVFAWTRAEGAPLLLGQINFFLEFDVCMYRSQCIFRSEAEVFRLKWRESRTRLAK